MQTEHPVLGLRTDGPEAELYLLESTGDISAQYKWQADRELANQLLKEIERFLSESTTTFDQLSGIVVYKGPGSFTGLRIGVTVANSLAYSLDQPVIATNGDNWLLEGAHQLSTTKLGKYALPEYGSSAHITSPKG